MSREQALALLLERYSVEVTARDRSAVEATIAHSAAVEVFLANLPGESAERLVGVAVRLRRAGLDPVPHIVARNIADEGALDAMLARLAGEAGVKRVLLVGGDRDRPAGPFESALQLIEAGLLEKHGIGRIALACYPEGHPRIADEALDAALAAKLHAAAGRGLDVLLVSQFAFEPEPVVALARRLRAAGIKARLRVGVAGPADRVRLVRYAIRCGVGASLRALKERRDLARGVLAGETPDRLLGEVALARAAEPALRIDGVHFFTFGAVARSVAWAEDRRRPQSGRAAASD